MVLFKSRSRSKLLDPLKLETAQMTTTQDGAVFEAAVRDINSVVLVTKFMGSRTSLPQMASNVVALVSDIDYTFKGVEEVKTFLEDPDFRSAALLRCLITPVIQCWFFWTFENSGVLGVGLILARTLRRSLSACSERTTWLHSSHLQRSGFSQVPPLTLPSWRP